jgi:hypothetical protein
MFREVRPPATPIHPDAIKLAERLAESARLTQSRPDHVYAYIDERGIVIADNYDNPFAVALIVTPQERVLAHLCCDGRAYEITEDQADHIAKGFFTYGADYAVSLSFDLECEY